MSEIVIRHLHRSQIVHSFIHIQTSLNIILRCSIRFELNCCLTTRIIQRLILLRNPTTLSRSLLFLISFFLLIFAKHSCYRFDCLFMNCLTVATSKFLIIVILWLRSRPERSILLRWILSFHLWNIVGIFLDLWMLGQGRFEIRAIHLHLSISICLYACHRIKFLYGFHFRMRMDGCTVDARWGLSERFFHLLVTILLFMVGKLCLHYSHIRFLCYYYGTIPSSRTILLAVFHLVRLYNLGSGLWKPLPSRVVISYSLGRGALWRSSLKACLGYSLSSNQLPMRDFLLKPSQVCWT